MTAPQPGCTCIPCSTVAGLCAVYQHDQVKALQAKYDPANGLIIGYDGSKSGAEAFAMIGKAAETASEQMGQHWQQNVLPHYEATAKQIAATFSIPPDMVISHQELSWSDPDSDPLGDVKKAAEYYKNAVKPAGDPGIGCWKPDETLVNAYWDGEHWTVGKNTTGVPLTGEMLDDLMSMEVPGDYWLHPGEVAKAVEDKKGTYLTAAGGYLKPNTLYEALGVTVDLNWNPAPSGLCKCGCGAGYDEHDSICPPGQHGPEEHGLTMPFGEITIHLDEVNPEILEMVGVLEPPELFREE